MNIKGKLVMLGIFVVLLAGVVQVNATSTNNIGFKFNIKANQNNSFSDPEECATTNPKRAWMVDFRRSTESKSGAKCVTRFWLEKVGVFNIGSQVSDDHDIKEESGRHFYASTKDGTNCNVKLGAENNNYSAVTYQATGYWDEETTVILK